MASTAAQKRPEKELVLTQVIEMASDRSKYQKRPEKELILTQVIDKARDRSQYPKHFPIGKHRGIEFSVSVTTPSQDKLSFFLHAVNKTHESKSRPYKLRCKYLFNPMQMLVSATRCDLMVLDSWNKFCLGELVQSDDSVQFEVRIWVPDCLKTFNDPSYSDASILVDGEEFLVSKLFLSSQCTFFDSAFKWAAEQGKEPKITVDLFYAYEMQNFLEVIHGEIITNDDDIATLLELSRYFDSPAGIRRCTQFLMNDTDMSLTVKYQMADEFGVSELKKLIIQSVKTVQELESLLPTDISELNKNDMSSFLEKSMELHRVGKVTTTLQLPSQTTYSHPGWMLLDDFAHENIFPNKVFL